MVSLFLFQIGAIRSPVDCYGINEYQCFYSRLVRLEGNPAALADPSSLTFLFQIGAIRSHRDDIGNHKLQESFYSRLVRLEVYRKFVCYINRYFVSIPDWCD